jgi:hypothetical protein
LSAINYRSGASPRAAKMSAIFAPSVTALKV